MRKLIIIPMLLLIGCTYNCSFANAQGSNSDMIDDTNTPETSIRSDLSVPAKLM